MSVDLDIEIRALMRAHVMTVSTQQPILRAIEILEENRISGAPVVTPKGQLAGFLSIRDIARSEHLKSGRFDQELRERLLERNIEEFKGPDPDLDEDELWSEPTSEPDEVDADRVEDWMNPEVISVSPDTSLKDVCKVMTAEKIHRVLVVENAQLVGIVSAFDVVRYLAG